MTEYEELLLKFNLLKFKLLERLPYEFHDLFRDLLEIYKEIMAKYNPKLD